MAQTQVGPITLSGSSHNWEAMNSEYSSELPFEGNYEEGVYSSAMDVE